MQNYNLKKDNKNGFTLVELTIYIALFVVVSALATEFLWSIVLGNIKETAFQEVQQNGRFVITKISQEIKKATEINNLALNSLSLQMADPKLNPTIFDLSDGKLRITQGTNPSYYLTTDQVIVNSLQFTDLSYDDTPGIIQIKMEINHINPANRREYQALTNLESSVSLVPGGAALSLQIKKPTARTDSTGWTTPALIYNYPDTPNDQSDSGSDTSMPDRDPAILLYDWAQKTEIYTSTVLKVNWRTNGLHLNDRFAIRYSKDGETNWLDLVPMGVHNETTIQASSVNLDNNQDLTLVRVKVVSDRLPNPQADGGTLYIYDIWTEGIF